MFNWNQFQIEEKSVKDIDKIEKRINFAIRYGIILHIKYKSQAQNVSPKWRNVAPVALVKAKKGTKFIQGWQLGGYSFTDGRYNAEAIWRNFTMDRMYAVELTDMKIKTAPKGFTGGARPGQEILNVADFDAIRKQNTDAKKGMTIEAEPLRVTLSGNKLEGSVIWNQRNKWATILNADDKWALVLTNLPIRDKTLTLNTKDEKTSWFVIDTRRLKDIKSLDLIQDKQLKIFSS